MVLFYFDSTNGSVNNALARSGTLCSNFRSLIYGHPYVSDSTLPVITADDSFVLCFVPPTASPW
jgi:hypothetical protein